MFNNFKSIINKHQVLCIKRKANSSKNNKENKKNCLKKKLTRWLNTETFKVMNKMDQWKVKLRNRKFAKRRSKIKREVNRQRKSVKQKWKYQTK
jgi:hypothetical protein